MISQINYYFVSSKRTILNFLGFRIILLAFLLLYSFISTASSSNERLLKSDLFQEKIVTGTVVDKDGVPLPGVNVFLKNTNQGTTTDFDGKYSISTTDNAILVFSFLGFLTQEISVQGKAEINVILKEDVDQLDEVIVTGYSAQSTRDITGAISIVNSEELESVAPTSIEQALQGQAAGITVGNEGGPGGSAAVRIRGFGTVNGNDPLYIIDGTPTNSGLLDINPNDIESLQILKDASAAAIYGIRAGNGVIIITTKKGSANQKPKLNIDTWTGVSFVPNSVFPDIATPQQHADAVWRASINNTGNTPSHPQFGNGPTPVLPNYIIPFGSDTAGDEPYSLENNRITLANKEGTDWLDELFNSAFVHNINMSASAGTENFKSYFSLNLLDQNGVALASDFYRITLRANTEFEISDKFKVGENVSLSYTERTSIDRNQSTDGTISAAIRMHPLIPVYDEGGNFAGSGAIGLGNADNPIARALRGKDNNDINTRMLGNFFGEYEIIQGLIFKSNLGFDLSSFNSSNFFPIAREGETVGVTNRLEERNITNNIYTWFNTLNYNNTFGKHSVEALAGTEYNFNSRNDFGASRTGFLFDEALNTRVLDLGTSNITNFGTAVKTSYFSIFGKVDYKFDDRYLLSFTLRRDGSSQFTEGNKYGTFPSGSIGWRISNENFMRDSKFITNLILKAGYGVIGSNASIPASDVADILSPNIEFDAYPFNGTLNTGYALASRGNPELTWETTTTTNIGLSATLFNQLDIEVDIYNSLTEDLLVNDEGDPTVLGVTNIIRRNLGEVENKGFDINVRYSSSNKNKFTYGIGVNLSRYVNEVKFLDPDNLTKFLDGSTFRNHRPNRTIAGQPLAAFFVKRFLGKDENGRFIFEDIDGDGDTDREDRVFIGNPHPDFTFGINFNAAYENWDISMLWQGSYGNDIYNFNKYFLDFNTFPGSKSVDYVQENGLPALTTSNTLIDNESDPSSFYLEDGSYIRMKNIQIGYSMPKDAIKSLGIDVMRLYIQGKNLLTITDYSGLDPEISLANFGSTNRNLTLGVDGGAYPIDRQILIGVNVTF